MRLRPGIGARTCALESAAGSVDKGDALRKVRRSRMSAWYLDPVRLEFPFWRADLPGMEGADASGGDRDRGGRGWA